METQQVQKNQEVEYRNELSDYLNQTFIFKGQCKNFKYNSKNGNYQITVVDLKTTSPQIAHLKLDYHVNIFSKPKDINEIGIDYDIEFEAQVITYYSWKKIEGIDVKVKNYGLKLIEIIDFERPEKGENKDGNN